MTAPNSKRVRFAVVGDAMTMALGLVGCGSAWMIVRTVERLTVRYLLDRPALTRDQFLDELTRLTLNYLRPGS